MRFRSMILAGACAFAFVACGDEPASPSGPPTEEGPANATVDRVVDGDTLVAEIDGVRERVRLIGIDTPESVAENRPDECFGAEAGAYLAQLLPEGTPITLILDEEERDQFDRLLAYVIRADDELFVNLDLIEQGYADTLFFPPNTFYAERFAEAVRAAEDAGLGLWGACGGPDVPLE